MQRRTTFLIYTTLLLAFFGLGVANVGAQISNTHANFSCPAGQVTVTYNLISAQPVDVTLYYSHNKCDWLIAQTVTGDLEGQTTGTGKTIIWNNYDDNVRLGKFYFKVVMPEPECEGVVINGVCWATRNLDVGGVFCENPEDYGAYFQWGRKADGHESSSSPTSVGPISGADLDGNGQPAGSYIGKFIIGSSDWRASQDTLWNSGTESAPIKTVNDPCPAGWRVPTRAELESLTNTTYVAWVWTTENGINGYRCTDKATGNTFFLPAAGNRGNSSGSLSFVSTYGFYWSSSTNSTSARNLQFYNGTFGVNTMLRASGYSVRCVAE